MASQEPIAAARISGRGTSMRITLPKEVAAKLEVRDRSYVGFFELDGKIFIKKNSVAHHMMGKLLSLCFPALRMWNHLHTFFPDGKTDQP